MCFIQDVNIKTFQPSSQLFVIALLQGELSALIRETKASTNGDKQF